MSNSCRTRIDGKCPVVGGGGHASTADLAYDATGYEPGVPDIPTLRTVTDHNDNDVCFVKEPPGWYFYDAASLVADNGHEVVRPGDVPALSPGRWIRVEETNQDITFFNAATPYVEINSASPSTIAYGIFPGTDVGARFSRFSAVLSRSGGTEWSHIDIYNRNNATIMAKVDYQPSGIFIYEVIPSNIPTGRVIYEIRAYHNGQPGASRTRVHSVSLR